MENWYKIGVQYIGDLFDYNKGRFYRWQDIEEKYGIKVIFLTYMGLIDAIPKRWKEIMIEHYNALKDDLEVVDEPSNTLSRIILSNNKPSGAIYKEYVNDENDQPWDRYEKWAADIDMSCFDTELDWYTHIKEWYICTKSTMLKSFIYNYNMRNTVTQSYLYKIGVSDTKLCPKCNKHEENILHLFWECKDVSTLWASLGEWLSHTLGIYITISKESALMNIIEIDVTYWELLSFIYTLCKKQIYNNRDTNNRLSLQHIINILKKYEKIERLIARGNKKIQNHFNKWLDLYILWVAEEDT